MRRHFRRDDNGTGLPGALRAWYLGHAGGHRVAWNGRWWVFTKRTHCSAPSHHCTLMHAWYFCPLLRWMSLCFGDLWTEVHILYTYFGSPVDSKLLCYYDENYAHRESRVFNISLYTYTLCFIMKMKIYWSTRIMFVLVLQAPFELSGNPKFSIKVPNKTTATFISLRIPYSKACLSWKRHWKL